MADFESNWQNAMGGHLDYQEAAKTGGTAGGDPPVKFTSHARSGLDITANIRDSLSFAVAGGYTDFKDESLKNAFKNLRRELGDKQAQKLLSQAFIFNQRTDVKNKSPEERLTQFYEMGSRDPDVNKTLTTLKNLGQGPLQGFRSSVDEGNQNITGDSRQATEEEKKNKYAETAMDGKTPGKS